MRVGEVTFVAFEDVTLGGDLDDADTTAGGIVRVEGDQVTVTAEAPFVQRLFLSTDATSVLAVVSAVPPDMGDVVTDGARKRIVELDPVTGEIVRDLGAPDVDGGAAWLVERVDRKGGRVAAQITADCGDVEGCVAERTWVNDGEAWTEVVNQRGSSWFWQAGGAAVSWSDSGPITWTDGTDAARLAGRTGSDRVASGSLLPPD